MKIKTKKARLIVKAIVCIVLSLAILIPATMFSLANDGKIYTSIKDLEGKVLSSDKLEYYDLEKGVYTSKQVTGPDENGEYTVTIDTYTSDVTYISGSTPPVDIMILLDNSASMITLNSTEDGLKSKRDMAKTAISNVLSDLVDKYHVGEANKIQTFVSLYTFANVCTEDISKRLEYRELNSDTKNAILKKIDGIAGNIVAGTNTGEGFERMKEKITARQAECPDHKQILLVLTDGAPAAVTGFDAFGEDYANTAISYANELKKNGVEIFCIGLNRDFIVDESLKENNNDEELAKNYLKNIVNKGSHSPKARKTTLFTAVLSSAWTAKQTKSFNWNDSLLDSKPSWEKVPDYYSRNISKHCYYQGAIEGQEKITESINNAILDALSINYTSKSTLLGDYSVKDTVSGYFEIVPNSAKFYKVEYTGMKKSFTVNDIEDPKALYGAAKREFEEDENKIKPLSLNYTATASTIEIPADSNNSGLVDAIVVDDLVDSTNEKHSGNKLRITYKIRPKDSFMGGSSVPTHDYANSGIYKEEIVKDEKIVTVVQSFDKANSTETNPVPKMSVELVWIKQLTIRLPNSIPLKKFLEKNTANSQ